MVTYFEAFLLVFLLFSKVYLTFLYHHKVVFDSTRYFRLTRVRNNKTDPFRFR